jgi:hypothetical protein
MPVTAVYTAFTLPTLLLPLTNRQASCWLNSTSQMSHLLLQQHHTFRLRADFSGTTRFLAKKTTTGSRRGLKLIPSPGRAGATVP